MDPMKKVHTYPLEREYEAWTIHGIEKYLRMRGLSHVVHAVSPHIEATWPADSKLYIGRERSSACSSNEPSETAHQRQRLNV